MELDDRPLFPVRERGHNFSHGWDKSFANRFGSAGSIERRRDITSIHAAIMDDICNVHIDEIGFVMRGIGSEGGMTPDFGQHLVDELLWKTFLSPVLGDLGEYVTINLPNSRTNEVEADRIGVELAARAGYNPMAAISLWEKMAKLSSGGQPPKWLSTHPSHEDRINDLKVYAQKVMPLYTAAKASPSAGK